MKPDYHGALHPIGSPCTSGLTLPTPGRRGKCSVRCGADPAEATSLPVYQGSFDAALCVQVLEYVPGVLAVLKEMRGTRPIPTEWHASCAPGTRISHILRSPDLSAPVLRWAILPLIERFAGRRDEIWKVEARAWGHPYGTLDVPTTIMRYC